MCCNSTEKTKKSTDFICGLGDVKYQEGIEHLTNLFDYLLEIILKQKEYLQILMLINPHLNSKQIQEERAEEKRKKLGI